LPGEGDRGERKNKENPKEKRDGGKNSKKGWNLGKSRDKKTPTKKVGR